ncbi:hypothetical protein [Nocardia farcinica]
MPTILIDGDNGAELARKLLAAAGDRPELVRHVTGGTRAGFSVPDEIAIRAGLMKPPRPSKPAPKPEPDPAPQPEQGEAEQQAATAEPEQAEPEPKKAPAKRPSK